MTPPRRPIITDNKAIVISAFAAVTSEYTLVGIQCKWNVRVTLGSTEPLALLTRAAHEESHVRSFSIVMVTSEGGNAQDYQFLARVSVPI